MIGRSLNPECQCLGWELLVFINDPVLVTNVSVKVTLKMTKNESLVVVLGDKFNIYIQENYDYLLLS